MARGKTRILLYDFIKMSHLGLNGAKEILQRYLSEKYEAKT